MPIVYIIMGPAGCGKSSIAAALSERAGWAMVEADDHHPTENVEKQRNQIPLTDADRVVWLDQLIGAINAVPHETIALACSALTPYVQSRLRDEIHGTCQWLLIEVPPDELRRRMTARKDHFMPVELLDNQLASLTPPIGVRRINGAQTMTKICDEILSGL
ncbi:MAG: gluconokinase, GntK/IdnK-type [Pseudomonadota bacterium]